MDAAIVGGLALVAYVGPGAGLGMLGSLLAVAIAVVVGLLGLVLYPLSLLRKVLRKSPATAPTVTVSPSAPSTSG
jgi:hypothetical protein